MGIVLKCLSQTPYSELQDTSKKFKYTSAEMDFWIKSAYDAAAYRMAYDSISAALNFSQDVITNNESVLLQSQKTIEAKDNTAAFYKSQAEMRSKENRKLEIGNKFWRIYSGLMTFIAGVSTMIILK